MSALFRKREKRAVTFGGMATNTLAGYHVMHRYSSTLKPKPTAITIVTHCTLDRLPYLSNQIGSWTGSLVAAILVAEDTVDVAKVAIRRIVEETDSNKRCAVELALCVRSHQQTAGANTSETTSTSGSLLYPINAMRNLALSMAMTDLVLLLDVDFQVSKGFQDYYDNVENYLVLWKFCSDLRAAVILPSFQVVRPQKLKGCLEKEKLMEYLERGEAIPFAQDVFPAGHRNTLFEKWYSAETTYSVDYEEGFEPFVLAFRLYVPPFDERFVGYAKNKIIHTFLLKSLGFTFFVHPHFFLIHSYHEKSSSWHLTLGSEGARQGRFRDIVALYDKAKREISMNDKAYHLQLRKSRSSVGVSAKQIEEEPLGYWLKEDANLVKNVESYPQHIIDQLYELRFIYLRTPKHEIKLHFRKSIAPRHKTDVTIVTTCSIDRLNRLENLCAHWSGAISVAIWIPAQAFGMKMRAFRKAVEELHNRVEINNYAKLDIALVEEKSDGFMRRSAFFPINYLRNIALEQVKTELIMILDVDFLPKLLTVDSQGKLRRPVFDHDEYEYILKLARAKNYLVFPAFQVVAPQPVATALIERVMTTTNFYTAKEKICHHFTTGVDGDIQIFHGKQYPAGHYPTDYHRWIEDATGAGSYEVEYAEGYEPFGIVANSNLPHFDDRFRGYGRDKISFTYHLHMLGYRFAVYQRGFILDVPHNPSKDRLFSYGGTRNRHHIHRIEGLYRMFRREIENKVLAMESRGDFIPEEGISELGDSQKSLVKVTKHRHLLSSQCLLYPSDAWELGYGGQNTSSTPGLWAKKFDIGLENVTRGLFPVGDAPESNGTCIKVHFPAGTWSPSSTREANMKPGGFVARLELPRAVIGFPQRYSLDFSYEIYFPNGFNFVKGGKLSGLWIRDGIRACFTWREKGRMDISIRNDVGSQVRKRVVYRSSSPVLLDTGRWHGLRMRMVLDCLRWSKTKDGLGRKCYNVPVTVYFVVDESPMIAVECDVTIGANAGSNLPTHPLGQARDAQQRKSHASEDDGGVSSYATASSSHSERERDSPLSLHHGVLLSAFFGGDTPDWATPVDTNLYIRNLSVSSTLETHKAPAQTIPAAA